MGRGAADASAMLFSSNKWIRLFGWRRRATTEGTLHQYDIDPAAELEADRGQGAGSRETESRMQANRRPCLATADDRDHLPVAEFGAAVEQGCEEGSAEAAPDLRVIDVDR